MKFVIGNWKANKNTKEVSRWADDFLKLDLSIFQDKITLVICPPFPFISILKERFNKFSFVKIGAQDISPYEPGTHTGEVTAYSLNGLIDFAIIGHSERRSQNNESEETIFKKFEMARLHNIEPILCIRNAQDSYPETIQFLMYEPPEAISTGTGRGNTTSLKDVLEMKKMLHIPSHIKYIYGGSVNPDNAEAFLKNDEIDGVLPGGESLDPQQFYQIATSAL